MTTNWHHGPDPHHGGMSKHTGSRVQCPGPDCGPDPVQARMAQAVASGALSRESAVEVLRVLAEADACGESDGYDFGSLGELADAIEHGAA